MKYFRKVFGKKTSTYAEKDNMGSIMDSVDTANGYWAARNTNQAFEPFVLYEFRNEKAARKSLLELDCIHEASDTGKLICAEMLTYGYYLTEKGVYEAILCGDELSHELWTQTNNVFAKNGGTLKNKKEPARGPKTERLTSSAEVSEVTYVGEEKHDKMGQTMIYHVYKGQDEASAKEFLKKNPVTKMLHYIIVETPDGSWGRDVSGIFKE